VEAKVGGVRERLPWWFKVFVKLALARLPVRYSGWRNIGVFKHGSMLNSEYAIDVFTGHYERARAWLPTQFSVLELGPGDSLATAVIAAVLGATRTLLVDAGAFASRDLELYQRLIEGLKQRGYDVGTLWQCSSVSELLRVANAVYLTDGLEDLYTVPSGSVDFVFSQAVIEHIRLHELEATFRELFRLQAPGGIGSHRVDFQDHLSHSLNSLRFSRAVWESRLLASSGFYTNRVRVSEIANLFVAAGYEIVYKREDRWATLPLSRRKMNAAFRQCSDEDLLVCGANIVVRKPN
jgi:hypothetical protein